MRPVLFFALIAAIGLLPQRTAIVTSPTRTEATVLGPGAPARRGPVPPAAAAPKAPALAWWYHPAGHRCPAWQYDGLAPAEAGSARADCEKYSVRWLNGAQCVPKSGPSIPSC